MTLTRTVFMVLMLSGSGRPQRIASWGSDDSLKHVEALGAAVRAGSKGQMDRRAAIGLSGVIDTVRSSEGLAAMGSMAVDRDGNILFVQNNGTRIVRILPNGLLSLFGGATNGCGGDGGSSGNAQFNDARDVTACTFRGDESYYVADAGNHWIRIILAGARLVQTAVGSSAGFAGDDGPAAAARLNTPTAVACNPAGDSIYIADSGNRRIRKVQNARITTVAGNGATGNPVIGPATQSPPLADIVSRWVGWDQSVYFGAGEMQ